MCDSFTHFSKNILPTLLSIHIVLGVHMLRGHKFWATCYFSILLYIQLVRFNCTDNFVKYRILFVNLCLKMDLN